MQVEGERYSDVLKRLDLGRHVFAKRGIPKYRLSTDVERSWVIRFYVTELRSNVDTQSAKGQICLLNVDCDSQCFNRLLSGVLRKLGDV